MPRPKRIVEVLEKARQLHGQLEAALKLLREHRSSLEALAALGLEDRKVIAVVGEQISKILRDCFERCRVGEGLADVVCLVACIEQNTPVIEDNTAYV